MPFYHAIVQQHLLAEPERQQFAKDVVDIHCDVTGAPPSFVHVLVSNDSRGRLADGRSGLINGTIRSGRNEAQKAEIVDRLIAALATRAGVDPATVQARTSEIQASFTMEGGALLPEPGSAAEKAWKLA